MCLGLVDPVVRPVINRGTAVHRDRTIKGIDTLVLLRQDPARLGDPPTGEQLAQPYYVRDHFCIDQDLSSIFARHVFSSEYA